MRRAQIDCDTAGTADAVNHSDYGTVRGLEMLDFAKLAIPQRALNLQSEFAMAHSITDPSPASVEENCPAFASGCPFSSTKDEAKVSSISKCPFFSEGCLFKGTSNVHHLRTMLESSIPASHLHHDSPLKENVISMFKFIHDASVAKKNVLGAACPVFSTSCPFKTIMVNDRALVDELEVRSWAVFAADDDEKQSPVGDDQLAKSLKYGTKKSHREAENVHFVREFIKGRINKDIYKIMVAMLYYIYSELEALMRDAAAKDDSIVAPLHYPVELERTDALMVDLEFYYGPNWRDIIPAPSIATQEYMDRLRFVGKTSPALLVAHAYTRYMGDLSGGQILRRTAIKAMRLENGNGTAFYDFPHIQTSHKAFKDMYRRTLNTLPVTHDVSRQLVQEANVAFVLNMKVFEELDVLGGFNTVENQRGEAVLRRRQLTMAGEQQPAASTMDSVCPFASMMGQPGIKELAIKYHRDELTADEFAHLKAEVDALKATRCAMWLKTYALSVVAVGVAIAVGAMMHASVC
ncbi:hypothetical protein H310_06568 [Aphanomyces invadans]|uniref:heme oxygenase (biliverdin-producing) n=1 Tax=Aphanomyces invadans TaxID=157072 RepID=A0A024U3Y4_9STRA|nr:hypothetical protein H310_06568 [Aphanomyces invadans]ETW00910.1 hypothetical protein H310_06568 [Aphanomyces invadans]|eukprot:XP_008869908.1 hypothetical protein H310_06568 [Aphanomyces invadans]